MNSTVGKCNITLPSCDSLRFAEIAKFRPRFIKRANFTGDALLKERTHVGSVGLAINVASVDKVAAALGAAYERHVASTVRVLLAITLLKKPEAVPYVGC